MLKRCLGDQRFRKFQRALRQCKVTVLCLVLTVVVLRGIIGAGEFGTPEKDFIVIRNRLQFPSGKRGGDPHRILEERRTASSSSATSDRKEIKKGYNGFNIKMVSEDDGEDEEKPDPADPHPLGPKISNWDAQRAQWLKENPKTPNFINDKPRVLLVTGSSPKACDNPVGDHYMSKSIKNKIDYCRVHGIEVFYSVALLHAEIAGFWARLPLIRNLLVGHPEVEFIWWMDSDAVFTDMTFEVPWEKYNNRNLVFHGWKEMVYGQKNWIGLNTGSFLLRNCQWSFDILHALAQMGPREKIGDEAGKILSEELEDRLAFEADDQSAVLYLLATERDKCGDKLYLESEYYLHGYWEVFVDRYGEMIEKYRPGLGDHQWPLVTHFAGCKPCTKSGDHPAERCLRQMDQAFNFGDNQIRRIYGSHNSVASRRVNKVWNVSRNPLEVRDADRLLSPTYDAAKNASSQIFRVLTWGFL